MSFIQVCFVDVYLNKSFFIYCFLSDVFAFSARIRAVHRIVSQVPTFLY